MNEVVTKRMDEFEDRLLGLFQEPVEKYIEKKRKKATPKEPLPVEEPPSKKVQIEREETPPPQEQFIPKKVPRPYKAAGNPFKR